jgi:hypothetical protein
MKKEKQSTQAQSKPQKANAQARTPFLLRMQKGQRKTQMRKTAGWETMMNMKRIVAFAKMTRSHN